MAAQSLVFQETTFDVIDRNGQPWLKAADIARALGYAREDSVSRIYERNADEFSEAMSQTVNLTVSGKINGLQNVTVRIFSLRGAHLLAMFARTTVAKAFRRWVLDILDRVTSAPAAFTTADERSPLRAAVSMLVGKRSLMYPEAYALVHQRFGVEHIDQLTPEQTTHAIEYVHRLVLEGEVLPAASDAQVEAGSYLLTAGEVHHLHGVFCMVDMMRDTLRELEPPLRLLKAPIASRVFGGSHEISLFLNSLQKLRSHCDGYYRTVERRVLGH